jgi:hypothetical protein
MWYSKRAIDGFAKSVLKAHKRNTTINQQLIKLMDVLTDTLRGVVRTQTNILDRLEDLERRI